MFVQVLMGKVRDQQGLQAQLGRWSDELAPGADGWLGTTAGMADDGTFVALARFESEDAARANSARPEQGAWWKETEAVFDGDVTFVDCPQVDSFGAGGSDDAGFVQVIQGRADRDQVAALGDQLDEVLGRVRPDVIGGILAWPGDGRFVEAVYFTSEADARKGESGPMSDEDAADFGRLVSLLAMERFFDLADPWLYSA